MSSVRTSGLYCGMRCSAIEPFAAVPTTAISASSSRACVTSRRMTTESSTTNTRIRSPGWRVLLFTTGMSHSSRMDSREFELLHENVPREWLHHVLIGASLHGFRGVLDFGLGVYHAHRHGRERGILTQPLQQIQAVNLRHVPIRQNQLYPAVPGFDN